ncbi:MAG: autotransporter outer membrane beta-barrel domain-containing protein [Phascolarctobacterium sp.]|nr:autotransporter outer membrane beta-barrel domain-containing protein [Phascolarctobacterium sp.]
MSKKMLKRSLALGALMAFVITGSAMAAELNGSDVTYKGSASENKLVNGATAQIVGTGVETVTFKNDQEKAVNGAMGGYAGKASITNVDKIVVNGKYSNVFTISDAASVGDYYVNLTGIGSIEAIDDGKKSQFFHGFAGDITVEAGDITLNNVGSAALAQVGNQKWNKDPAKQVNHGSQIKIDVADNFVVTTSQASSVIAAGNYNRVANDGNNPSVEITAGNMNIDAKNSTAFETYGGTWSVDEGGNVADGTLVGIANVDVDVKGTLDVKAATIIQAGNGAQKGDSSVNINAGTINFVASDYLVDAYHNAAVNVVADTAVMSGNVSVQGGSVVNLALGKEGSFTGNINTDATSTTTLDLGTGSTWNITSASTITEATFGADSKLVLFGDGDQFTKDYAINGTGADSKLNFEGFNEEDKVDVEVQGIKNNIYNVAKDFTNITEAKDKFDVTNLNSLMQGEWTATEKEGLQLKVSSKSASDIATNLGATESTGNFVKDIIDGGNNEATDFLDNLIKNAGDDNAVVNDTLNAVQKMGEAGGNSATAANIVKNVTGVTNDRLSFNCGHSAPHKGGHGVGLFEEGSGADIWVEYVHGKDEVEDMPSTAGASSYEGQYNGIVMGVDFKKVGKFQSGIAFNYGEGDTNSVGSATRTHSDYDFWGVGYYGNIHNDDSNVIFDINYAQTDSDVTQSNPFTSSLEASPETTTWSAGVKLEKLYQNENVQIVPYTGLRYMSIDSDDYATKGGGFMYNMDRQDIWLLPLGVSIRQEVANDNGWTVSPRVDLSYIWAFGDTNSNMEVKSGNGITPIGYDVMDDGSFLGLVGIEAHKGQWGYGVAYSYQKGDHSESKKWYVDVNYSF